MATDPWAIFKDAGSAPAGKPVVDDWDRFSDAPDAAPAPVAAPRPALPTRPFAIAPRAAAYDGDTFAGPTGNTRLYGADAFELRQPGRMGAPVDLGAQARDAFRSAIAPGGTATPTGTASWGRPVASLDVGGADMGRNMVAGGYALPTPEYLRADPSRMSDYLAAQRGGIAAERGAYAGQYQSPTDFRRQGAAAPWQGKTPMSPDQLGEYRGILSNPASRPADLEGWATRQGNPMANAGNLLQFSQRTPTAATTPLFQQRDVTGAPVLRDGPGLATRLAGSLNEGLLADVVGGPVDLVNTAMGAVGLPVGNRPLGGSQWISDQMHKLGLGQTSDAYAPRSDLERYAQAVARGVGQAALPVGGALSIGARLAASAAPVALRSGNPLAGAIGSLGREAWAAPGVSVAGEMGGGVGAGIGGQGMRDAFPGNPYADAAGQVIGGFGGGMGTGMFAARRAPVGERLVNGIETGADSAGGEAINSARNGMPDAPAGIMDAEAFSRQANAMFQAGASPDDLRRFAAEAGGYRLDGMDKAFAYRDSGKRGAGVTSVPGQPPAPVRANVPQSTASDDGLGPSSIISPAFVPEKGPPGVSVVDDDGHFASAIFRDQEGRAQGGARIPLTPEAREISPEAGVYVRPEYRRQGVATQLYDALRSKGYPIDQISGSGDLTPEGAAFVNARRTASMSDGIQTPGVTGAVDEWDGFADALTARLPDRLDVWDQFADAPDFAWENPVPGFSRGAGVAADPARMAALARGAQPDDFRRLPANTIASLDEAMQANPGSVQDVNVPDPRSVLPPYRLGNANRRHPADVLTWLRANGGLQDQGGELASMGLTNRPRDFDRGEGFAGSLIRPGGMTFDQATERLTSAGFFNERPTVNALLDAIDGTNRGTNRLYRPDDLNTLDDYQRAQANYDMAGQLRDEGRPLAQAVGEPIDMADLDRNQPPPVAYEDLERVASGRVGNIDLTKLQAPQDISRALTATDYQAGGFGAARRGKVSQNETRQLARELGMSSDDLLKRQRGQALNAEQAFAARAILAKSGDELTTLAGKAAGDSDADKVAFRQGLLRHMAIQEQVSGATAEAGRALAQYRMIANSRDVSGKALKRIIEDAGGGDRLEDIAAGILELRDPSKRAKFLRDATRPTWADKLVELRYNMMLSGPQTHTVNIVSNTLTSLAQLPEHAVAAGLGYVRKAVGRGDDRVLASEVGARAGGLVTGFREGLRQLARTVRTGETLDSVGQVEAGQREAISGRKGYALRTPTRLLAAEDELFKAMGRRMELAGLATRKAYGVEKLTGDAGKRRVADLMANPPEEMLAQAFDYARYVTFQRPLGEVGNRIQGLANAKLNGFPVVKLIVPFVRTPTNLLKFALERSPAAPVLSEWRADVSAGGARRDLAVARAMIGSAAGMSAIMWAAEGHLTGAGPADKSAKRLMQANGWQPYSLKIGDRYYSYRRMDPFSTTFGIAADMVELQSHMTDDQAEKVGSLLAASVLQNLASKTWLSGLSDLGEAIGDPARYGDQLTTNIITSFMTPAFSSQAARTIDPYAREAQGVLDRIRSRVPGLSQALPMRRDILGRPIMSEGGLGPDMMTPIWTSTDRRDPTINALLAANAGIGRPSRKVGDMRLTPQQYSDYTGAIGREAVPWLNDLTRSPDWRTMDREMQQDAVDKLMKASRKRARTGMFGSRGDGR